MNLNPVLALPSRKKAILMVLIIAILGGIAYGVYDKYGYDLKLWHLRSKIARYLKKQTGQSNFKCDFSFDVAKDLSTLQTNISTLDAKATAVQDKLGVLQKEMPMINRLVYLQRDLSRKEGYLNNYLTNRQSLPASFPFEILTNKTLLSQEVDKLKAVVEPVSAPLQPLRDEIAALETTAADKRKTLNVQRQTLNALQRQITTGRANTADTNSPALTVDELTGVSNKISELKGVMNPIQEELASINKQINSKNSEISKKLGDVLPQLTTLRYLTNTIRAQADFAQAQKDLEAKLKEFNMAPMPLADREKLVSTRQQEMADMRKSRDTMLAELSTLRKDFNAKKSALDSQQNVFSQQFLDKYRGAKTYGQMYVYLGQQLWVAEQLSKSTEDQKKRLALAMYSSAARNCSSEILNYWLSALICEAYITPNLGLVEDDQTRGGIMNSLIQQCMLAFRDVDELDKSVEMLQYALKRAKQPRAQDGLRVQLSKELELTGRYFDAANTLRAIKDTNNFKYAMQRIPWLEQRAQKK